MDYEQRLYAGDIEEAVSATRSHQDSQDQSSYLIFLGVTVFFAAVAIIFMVKCVLSWIEREQASRDVGTRIREDMHHFPLPPSSGGSSFSPSVSGSTKFQTRSVSKSKENKSSNSLFSSQPQDVVSPADVEVDLAG